MSVGIALGIARPCGIRSQKSRGAAMRGIKRRIYGMPILAAYRDFRTMRLSGQHRDHPLGFKFAGADTFFRPDWEAAERDVAIEEMARAAIFVDVGANQGVYTCLACHKGLGVVAIEPERGNLRFLLRNLEKNGFDAEVYPVALGDRPGAVRLFGDGDTASLVSGWAETASDFGDLVPANTLDNLIAHRWPGKRLFIKIDVEGAELDVLRGASQVLARDPKPSWLIEAFPRNYDAAHSINVNFEAVFEAMFAAGYVCRRVDTQTEVTMAAVREWTGDRTGSIDLGGSNYLFTAA